MKNKVFFIAEISANHCGNFNLAKKLIKCAYDNGADAVKLQTFTADTMTIKSNKKFFKIKEGLWKGYSLWDLYNDAHTPLKWHNELFKYAQLTSDQSITHPAPQNALSLWIEANVMCSGRNAQPPLACWKRTEWRRQ